MSDTTFAVEFRAFSFASKAKAKACEEKLQDAFCAMPEADGVAAVSRVVQEADAPTFTAADLERAWQPIETAPRDGTAILSAGGGLEQVDICAYNARIGGWSCGSCTLDDTDQEPEGYNRPTHWMPLPPPPADLAQRVKKGPAHD